MRFHRLAQPINPLREFERSNTGGILEVPIATALPCRRLELPDLTSTFSAVVLTQGKRPNELQAAITSLLRQHGVQLDVLVVGNGWQPHGLPTGVQSLGLPENVGIPAGRNAGASLVSGDLLVFLDDDELLEGDDFLARASKLFAEHHDLGMIQPRIDVLGPGEPPRRWTPRIITGDRTRSSRAFRVVEGAIVVRSSAFRWAGGWAEPFWYAHEGIELAWRVWDYGLQVWYVGDLVARHPSTLVTRHESAYRFDGRNRVLLARRNLPAPLGILYNALWLTRQIILARRQPTLLLPYLAGLAEGIREHGVEKRRLRRRTILRMTRHGHPPVF